ncbi:hypothetical protein [Bradyrhizobium japonicum]|uniref:hypothetical protein n=1 Tax=Bradyrhizobium japonicum TaxID=375 RepID=UPI001E2ACE84|nr:hypothetical protein [Bradyrhizobium japonicum]MCD9824602.1 hypothetical protein [Bradyrhizobium japonicum]MCD9897437.1 hypothetical protein [Bradyrhizobium japonicum]MEB2671180.1 hypothetical protein [Bradyrhizobium japonicum]WLB28583.1 hypothetical protein QIH85_43570 [Bradyrhizobium japonicum]WRI90500.1 hypothetical protein R3F75_05995 [Bradyrhizobium japonicum]
MGHRYIRLNSLIGKPSHSRAAARNRDLRGGMKVRASLPDQFAREMKEIGIALESAVLNQFV